MVKTVRYPPYMLLLGEYIHIHFLMLVLFGASQYYLNKA